MIMKATIGVAGLCLLFFSSLAQTPIKKFRSISNTYAFGDKVLICADDGVTGNELWISDGTPEGTTLLADIHDGSASSGITTMFTFNGKVYFGAYTPLEQNELWSTDGTPEGTAMFADLAPANSNGGTSPRNFAIFNDNLYFTSSDSKLYRTSGSASNLTVVDLISRGHDWNPIVAAGKLYYYKGSDILYWTDGTNSGNLDLPLEVDDTFFKALYTTGEQLYAMRATTYDNHIRLYSLNHATNIWTNIFNLQAPLYGDNEIDNFTAMDGKLFFTIRKDYDNVAPSDELWVTDGTAQGTVLLKSFAWDRYWSGSSMENFKVFNHALYFRSGNATDRSLWKSDGTPNGTAKLHDVIMVTPNYLPNVPVIANDRMYFAGTMSEYGADPTLWSTDGTVEGTKAETNLSSNLGGLPFWLTSTASEVYFVTAPDQFNADLWSTAPAAEINLKIVETRQELLQGDNVRFYGTRANDCLSKTLQIRNDGHKSLALGSAYITGSDFAMEGTLPQMLAPGQDTTIKVWFHPYSTGSKHGTFTIASGDDNEGTFSLQLTGDVVASDSSFCEKFHNNFSRYIDATAESRAILLSNRMVAERMPEGTVVGNFSFPGNDGEVAYSLVAGDGDTHNDMFTIDGTALKTEKTFIFGDRNYYTIRVGATLQDQSTTEEWFLIEVQNALAPVNGGSCEKQAERLDFGLLDVAINAKGQLFTTTSTGEIQRSDDDGQSWTITNVGFITPLRRIFFKGATGYIIGDNTIFKSEDDGETWFQLYIPAPITYGAFCAFFLDENTGYVSAEDKGVYFTADGGRTWEVRQTGYNDFNNLWFVTKDNGFATTFYRDLYKTTDGGKTWAEIDLTSLGYLNGFTSFWFLNATEGFLATYQSLLHTTDGGNTWQKVQLPISAEFHLIRFADANKGYVVGRGIVLQTIDGGKTWTGHYPAVNITGIAFQDDKLYISAASADGYNGTGGRALHVSPDNGQSWQSVQRIDDGNHYTISFPSVSTGFICGQYGNYKTDDGGNTWNAVAWTTAMSSAQFLNESTALFSDGTNLYRSADGGETITEVFTGSTDPNNYKRAGKLFRATDSLAFSVGTNEVPLYRSRDAGLTWTSVEIADLFSYVSDMYFISSDIGYLADFFGSVFKTTDAGLTWTEIFTSEIHIVTRSIFFVNEQVGYRAGQHFSRTTDGGITWQDIFIQPNFEVLELNFTSELHGYLVSTTGKLFETSDGGNTWTEIYIWDGQTPSAVEFRNGNIYLTGAEGYIAQYKNTRAKPLGPGYISGKQVVCSGDVEVYDLATNYAGSYTWRVPGATVKDHSSSAEVHFDHPGEYTITVASYNECGITENRTLTVRAEELETPVITGEVLVGSGSQKPYEIENSDNVNVYAWDVSPEARFATDESMGAISVTWPDNAMDATISAIATNTKNGCRKRATDYDVTVFLTVGIENEAVADISAYPNATTDVIAIDAKALPLYHAELYDMHGRIVRSKELTPYEIYRINVGNLSPGVYLLKLSAGHNIVVTKRIVKK